MSSSLLTASQSNAFVGVNRNLTPHYIWDECFRLEKERLKTFENWPLEWLDKNILAATGMFYTGVNDQTKCYFCEIIIGKWEHSDDPVQEHLRWSPNCPLLQRRRTDNIALNDKTLDQVLPPAKKVTYDTPPSSNWESISCHNYSIKEIRLQSFANWPRSIKQKPQELAEAGFFYSGFGDSVICFSCQGGLKDWEVDDDPWEQHALWMGHYCPYIKLIKGEEYIKSVHCKFKNYHPIETKQNSESKQSEEIVTKTESSVETDDLKLCKICLDKEYNTAYVPCGHVVACSECALTARNCPVCRTSIQKVVRLYFS